MLGGPLQNVIFKSVQPSLQPKLDYILLLLSNRSIFKARATFISKTAFLQQQQFKQLRYPNHFGLMPSCISAHEQQHLLLLPMIKALTSSHHHLSPMPIFFILFVFFADTNAQINASLPHLQKSILHRPRQNRTLTELQLLLQQILMDLLNLQPSPTVVQLAPEEGERPQMMWKQKQVIIIDN